MLHDKISHQEEMAVLIQWTEVELLPGTDYSKPSQMRKGLELTFMVS